MCIRDRQYPIFRIDFNGGPYTQPGVLEAENRILQPVFFKVSNCQSVEKFFPPLKITGKCTHPVSYTHLDVYKRQYEDRMNQRLH